jgi:glycerol-3-phosphate acyltransferase PlsY
VIQAAACVLLAYLCGSVPAGHLAARRADVDLRRRGSGNLGSSNVFRVLGPRAAVPVAAVDVLKGFVPVWYFPLLDGTAVAHLPLVYGAAAIAGHVWSVFLRFEGGKGIATAAGVLLALSPVTGLIAATGWLGLLLSVGAPSVASLTAVTLTPLVAWGLGEPGSTVAFTLILVPFAWWTHRDNLMRLRRGDELALRGNDGESDGSRGAEHPTPRGGGG